jgi:hypothetical protein
MILRSSSPLSFIQGKEREANSPLDSASENGRESGQSAPFRKCCETFFPGNEAFPQGLTPLWGSITLLFVANFRCTPPGRRRPPSTPSACVLSILHT